MFVGILHVFFLLLFIDPQYVNSFITILLKMYLCFVTGKNSVTKRKVI